MKSRKVTQHVILEPTTPIKPFINKTIPNNVRLGQAVSEIQSYSWILLTDVQAADLFFKALLEQRLDVRRLTTIKFAVSAGIIKAAVEQRGILVEYMPLGDSIETLANGLVHRVHPSEKILLLRGQAEEQEISEILAKHFIAYDDIPIYYKSR